MRGRRAAGCWLLLAAGGWLAGCGGLRFAGPRWDPDAPVRPLREPAPEPQPEPRLRSYVVLLPEADGRVGALEVETAAGSRTLSQAGEALDFDDPDRALRLSDAEVRREFPAELAAEPPPPLGIVLYFPSGSDRLTAESARRFSELVPLLAARPVPEVSIAGHADRAGSEAFNRGLSERRARRIEAELQAAGLDPDLIEVRWYGESQPAVATADGVPEEANRRVEIRVR